MRYRARFHYDGLPKAKWMDYLRVGDQVELVNNGKKTFKVVDTWKYKGVPVYVTDQFGLVGANELEQID